MINGIMTLSGVWHKLRDRPHREVPIVVSLSFYGMSTFEGPMTIRSRPSTRPLTDWTIGHVHPAPWLAGFISIGSIYMRRACSAPSKCTASRADRPALLAGTMGVVPYIAAMWISG